MKAIRFADIKDLHIAPKQWYAWADDAIRHKKDMFLPPKTHMNMEGNIFCNVMPSIVQVDGKKIGGVKIVTRYPKREPSLDSTIILFDAETGEFLTLMDGNIITAMRTGAVAAHSVLHFGTKGFSEIGMIGLGNTARSTLLILQSMVPDQQLNIKLLRYKDQAERFEQRFAEFDSLHFTICDTYEQCVQGSQVVISCATYFENDLCSDECFDEGVTVVPVHTRGFTNCDLFFDKVYADDTGHVDHFRNFAKFRQFAEVSDVLNGEAPGRENDQERILAYNIGLSIHDIYCGYKIYEMLKKDEEAFAQLQDIDLAAPTDKFWV